MDGEAGWWTTIGNIGLPPLARVMGVGRQQQEDILGHFLFDKDNIKRGYYKSEIAIQLCLVLVKILRRKQNIRREKL